MRVRAPELRAGEWVNAPELTLAELRGRVVLLAFWSYCSVNCTRVLDEVAHIADRFAEEVVVIAVHSPKFPREHDRRAVAEAVLRQRVRLPVLDDPELRLWHQYGIKGWPTVVVIDPEGAVVGGASGEGVERLLLRAVEAAVAEHDAKGTLVRAAAPATSDARVVGTLAFPGKVASDGARHLALSDTGHDRVLVTDLGGRREWEVTGLQRPQGVRFEPRAGDEDDDVDEDDDGAPVAGAAVVICDTGADRVVRVDPRRPDQIEVLAEGLSAPWDLVAAPSGGWLVAEAGRHRLWHVPARAGDAPRVVAGSGDEGLTDGAALDATLAQPSGLARLPGGYAVADSESSAVRVFTDDGRVATLVGAGLFEWGDADGGRDQARLQHPLGVAAAGGHVYVADSFNGRLRHWHDGVLVTLPSEPLAEPGGVDVLPDGRLVVADTNHHRVVTVDPDTGVTVSVPVDDTWTDAETGPPIVVPAGRTITLEFDIDVADPDLDRSDGHPVRVVVEADPARHLGEGARRWDLGQASGTVSVTAGEAGQATLVIDVVAAERSGDTVTLRRSRRRHQLTVR